MSDTIPQPKRMKTRLEELPDGLRIIHSGRSIFLALFLGVWLAGWTLGCVGLVRELILKPQIGLFLFGIPFWAAWVFVAAALAYYLLYREEFTLTRDGVDLQTRWLRNSQRLIPLDEVVKFRLKTDDSSDSITHTIQLVTTGEPLEFGSNAPVAELNFLVFRLNEQLRAWNHNRNVPELSGEEDDDDDDDDLDDDEDATDNAFAVTDDDADATSDKPAMEVLELRPPAEVEISPPTATRWRRVSDIDGEALSQRGRWEFTNIGMLLFVCLFWNGIVGVFVGVMLGIGPFKNDLPPLPMRIALFLFLIPFEIIGLLIVVGVLAAIFDPLRFTRWMLYRNRIAFHQSYLGLGWTWNYEIRELERLELRKDLPPKNSEDNQALLSAPRKYSLAFIDLDGKDVCAMKGLELGEAVWFADIVLRERAGWFRMRK